jgi:uncharacterized protein YutE (UPF0331/DUF86 family)
MELRKLNALDLMKVVTIFGKVGANLKFSDEMSNTQLGIHFISVACQYAEKEVTELLASLAKMSVEDFGKQPIDFPIEVIESLAEKEDLKSFFTRVGNLTKKLSKKQ